VKDNLSKTIKNNNSSIFIIITISIIFSISTAGAITIRGEIGNPDAGDREFGVKIIDIQGDPTNSYPPGKWIVVRYDSDYIQFDLKRGICVELQGAWLSVDHFRLTGPCREISCFQPTQTPTQTPTQAPTWKRIPPPSSLRDINVRGKINYYYGESKSNCALGLEITEVVRGNSDFASIGKNVNIMHLSSDAGLNVKEGDCVEAFGELDTLYNSISVDRLLNPNYYIKKISCPDQGRQVALPIINNPPTIIILDADKLSPQSPGSLISWTAVASDPEKDPIYYKFISSGPGTGNQWKDMTGWIASNTWTWSPTSSDTGENSVGAFVRDGKHASEDDYDDYKGQYFVIGQVNQAPIISDLLSDEISPQPEGKSINWEAIASDPDNDQIYYKFMINGPGTNNSWTDMTGWRINNKWLWMPDASCIGENSIGVFVRDGKHAAEDDYDSYKGKYCVIEQGNLPPAVLDLSATLESPQQEGMAINWTATSSDPENDQIYYKFMLSGPGTNSTWKDMSGWITSNVWTWEPTISDIGENSIGVFVRDGEHAVEDNYDDYKGEYFSIEKSEQEAECDSPIEFQGEVISEHDYFGRYPTLEIRINKFLSEPKLEASIIEVERPSLTDLTIEMGDCVEVIGCPIKSTEDAKYAGGWLISRASKPFSVSEISCEDEACGKILNYNISNGQNYPRGQTILADLKYKSSFDSEVDFKGVLLVKSPTGQIYSNYKEQRTPPNREDSFGNNKGNAIDLKIPEDASLGSYSAKLELRRSDTDELCDSTDWIQNQFTIGYRCLVQGGVIEKTKKNDELLFKLDITKIDCLESFGHKAGDIISVYYNKYENIGECVEVEGGFDPGNYDGNEIDFFATKAPKTITCPSEYSKPQCAPGPVGNTQCFGNIAKQLYQSENCEQEWQIVEDCTNYGPSKCCNNGQCENCGEGPKPSEKCRDITIKGIVNDVGDLTWDCKDWTGGGIAKLWEITVDNIEGTPLSSRVIKVYSEDLNCNSADTSAIKGSVDEKIAEGDHVEVFGCYNETESSMTLSGKREYYIKIINGCKGIISGHVYDYETKQPIPSHAFLCVNLSEKDACGACLETDDSGIYEFSKCPKGLLCQNTDYSVYCWADHYETQVKTEKTDDEGNKVIDFYLKKKEPDVILFTGVFDSISTEEGLSWSVILNEKLSGPDPCSQELEVTGPSESISNPAYRQVDKSIRKGDHVEVLGEYVFYPQTKSCAIVLFGSNDYYLRKCNSDWWRSREGIESFAQRQKFDYGALDYDYLENDNYVIIALTTGDQIIADFGMPLPKVKLLIFDKYTNKFIIDRQKGSKIYMDFFIDMNKDGFSKTFKGEITVLREEEQELYKFWDVAKGILGFEIDMEKATRWGSTLISCVGLDIGCVSGFAVNYADCVLSNLDKKVGYQDILNEVYFRDQRQEDLLEKEHDLLDSANFEKTKIDLLEFAREGYEWYGDYEKYEAAMALSQVDSLKILEDINKAEAERQKRMLLKSGGLSLFSLLIDPSSYGKAQEFAFLASVHGKFAEEALVEADEMINRFYINPTYENYEDAIGKLMLSCDNLAVGYILISESIRACKESPTGFILSPFMDVDNSINKFRTKAENFMAYRAQLNYYEKLFIYLDESIVEVINPKVSCN